MNARSLRRFTLLPLVITTLAALPAPASARDRSARGLEPPDTSGVPADTFRLPGLVATAVRVPMPVEALPTPVTVLTGEELRERGVRTVADALRAVPAAAIVQAGPAGSQTSLFLRGGQSGYVKVLVDGVPVNDPGGALDLADLTTDQVERIEIVRGPASVLYGSDAVTGVVQVFTRRGQGAPTLSLSTVGGRGERRHDRDRFSALDAAGTLSGSAGAVGYTLGGGRSWNAGAYPINSDRRIDVLNGRIDWAPSPRTELAFTGRISDSDTGFPTDGAGNLVDLNARLERRSLTASVEAGQRLGDRLAARIQVGLLERDQLARDEPDGPADTLGVFATRLGGHLRRLAADARLDLQLPRGTIASLGAALHDQRGRSSYASDSEWGPYDHEAGFRRRNRGTYAQLLAEPVDRLNVTGGIRLDHNDLFGTFFTHRIGVSYGLGATRVRGALGRAFREPTFAESFGSGFGDRGNPDLVPESSRSWEVGMDRDLVRGVRLGLTWFDQRFQDMIQFSAAPGDPDDPNYFNVGAARARGVELTTQARRGPVAVDGSYTWLATRVLDPGLATDAGFVQGEPLLRRPAHAAGLTGRYRLPHGSAGLSIHHVGERYDLDFGAGFPAPRVTMPAYTTVGLAAEHALPIRTGPALDLLVRLENLLDARYDPVHGFPAPGRLVAVGLRLRM
jgi:vitamin B12 transporter